MIDQPTNLFQRYRSYWEPVAADPIVRGYFSLMASLFLTAFLAVFALSPTINTILGLNRKIADQKKIIAALDAKTVSLITAQQNQQQVADLIPLIDQALPEVPHPQGVIKEILNIATASGVEITSLQFKNISLTKDVALPNDEAKTALPTVGFLLSLKGNDDRTRVFLGQLEKQLRYIRTKSFTLTAGAADVTGVAYYERS